MCQGRASSPSWAGGVSNGLSTPCPPALSTRCSRPPAAPSATGSLALQRGGAADAAPSFALRRLIDEGRAAIVGPIRQELLSGIRDRATFDRLRAHLGSFPDEPIAQADYERAAQHFNTCRAKGV